MDVLITYLSKTGNTKALGERFYQGLKDIVNTNIMDLDKGGKEDLEKYDLIIIGSWVHRNTVIGKAQKLIDKVGNKNLIIYGTAGVFPETPLGDMVVSNIKDAAKSNGRLLDVILLNGKVDPKTIKTIDLIPSFAVSKEKKETMKQIMKDSRPPTEEEYQQAVNRCVETVVKAMREGGIQVDK